ncbi:MAG: hypothetical protein IT582_10215 [Opitutaceae bacterium]|nr:hypothetical protein [Opitutaceae bacterium]
MSTDLKNGPRASQVIARLNELIAKHGDLPVWADDADTGWRLPIGIVYRPVPKSVDQSPRFEIKTDYHADPDGLISANDPDVARARKENNE